jgi:hypothetical protein
MIVHVNVSTSCFLFMVYLANQITTGWLARKDRQIGNRSVSFSSVEQKITHFHQKISNLQADFLNTSCASVSFHVDGKRNIWNGHGYRQSHWDRLTVTVCILFCSWWECAWVHYRGGSLRGDSMTDGWLKLVFVKEILVRPMSISAT